MSNRQSPPTKYPGIDLAQVSSISAASAAKPDGGDGYAPASSLETVDAFLTSIGAGQPLDAEAEKKALTGSK